MVLAGFADLAAPLLGGPAVAGVASLSGASRLWADLPWRSLPWAELSLLPPAAALIGWLTAQVTLRRWLRRLP